MKILIAGSRTLFPNDDEIDLAIALLLDAPYWRSNAAITNDLYIITGMAKGVDKRAYEFACHELFNPPIEMPADWNIGKHAGHLRNTKMVALCDKAILFWDGKSNGTRDTLRKLIKANKHYILVVRGA